MMDILPGYILSIAIVYPFLLWFHVEKMKEDLKLTDALSWLVLSCLPIINVVAFTFVATVIFVETKVFKVITKFTNKTIIRARGEE